MNHKYSKSIFILIVFAVMLLVTASLTTWKVVAQEPQSIPFLRAHPVWEAVDGWNWPQEATLTLMIDDPNTAEYPDLQMDMVVEPDPSGSNWFNFNGIYDLKAGDLVTMTDGNTTRTLVVSILSIAVVDVDANIVSGQAEPGALVRLPVPDNELLVEADLGGNWTANFQEIGFDLQPGTMIIAENFDEDGDLTSFEWFIPNPHFTVFPEWEFFDGMDWPDEATVTIEVVGKGGCTVTKESWGNFFNGNFGEGCNLEIGDTVTFTDGTTTRTHTVQNLAISEVNKVENTIAGTADPGALVYVWPHDAWFEPLQVTANEEGFWQVDLDDAGYDIQEGASGRAQINDDVGNATAVDWYVPNPHFTVFPEWEWFDGMDWPDGAIVEISVEGKPECDTSKESWSNFFNGGFGEGCNVEIGDTVTFTDGETTRTHTVQNLGISNVDKIANTVSGTADDGMWVHVWVHELGGDQYTEAVGGTWLADIGQAGVDLQELMSGRAEILDDYGNATAVDWYLPNPYFVVFPEWEWFDGMDWQYEGAVTISVEGKPECGAFIESPGNFFNGSFGEMCNIEFGDVVTFAGNQTVRTHVVRKLMINDVDVEADRITGKAHKGELVYVWPHSTGEALEAKADKNGSWLADFYGQYDLELGEGGRAEIRDDMGNATAVDWYIPRPIFTIYPDAQWFDGNDWPDGATVEITVADKPECTVEIESWGGFFGANFPQGCFVTAGDLVTYKHGTTIRTHTVRNLAIKIIDKEADTVRGVGDPGEDVIVWAWYMADGSTVEGSNTEVTTDENGSWMVDYNAFGIDLADGMGIQAMILDPEGNATSVDLGVPNPRMVASITEDWFFLADFLPDETVYYSIYSSGGGDPVWEGSITTDVNGFVWVNSAGWDLEPGNRITVSDGRTSKELTIEAFTFDVFDTTLGYLQGTAPEPFGRGVWVGIGWENDMWSMEVNTNEAGRWVADFGTPVPENYLWVAAQIFDEDGDASELRPSSRSIMAGNFAFAWSQSNPEEVMYLSWNGSANLANPWAQVGCTFDLEYFGNSWVMENESTVDYFFASLVGWGSTGAWSQAGSMVDISSMSSGCPSSANIPIQTTYQFFDDELRANLISVTRTFEFGETPYQHNLRPFIPRIYPFSDYTDVFHPNEDGTALVSDATCDFGCKIANWNGTWFAIHNPNTGSGMIVLHAPSEYAVALWTDNDGGSYTNASSVLLLQPEGGFVGTVSETEYLCFYDSSTWTPSLTLPSGCQP